MVKKEITYTDYNGTVRTEPFYFNITRAELATLELTHPGGFQGYIKEMTDSKDTPTLVRLTKELLLMSYGEKTSDGKYLMKNDEIRQRFECSPAYEQMFMMLATDDQKTTEFINAIIPSDLRSTAIHAAPAIPNASSDSKE